MIFTDKKTLRKEIKKNLNDYKDNFEKDSETITEQIIKSHEYKNADTILSYMALPDEVDINIKKLSENKTVFIPKVRETPLSLDFYKYSEDSVKTGAYGITEPDETSELFHPEKALEYGNILVLVPGRAFTKNGKRLGRGKGFYDRFLQQLKENTPAKNLTLAGVCFPPQLLADIPTNKYDIFMDIIFLE